MQKEGIMPCTLEPRRDFHLADIGIGGHLKLQNELILKRFWRLNRRWRGSTIVMGIDYSHWVIDIDRTLNARALSVNCTLFGLGGGNSSS